MELCGSFTYSLKLKVGTETIVAGIRRKITYVERTHHRVIAVLDDGSVWEWTDSRPAYLQPLLISVKKSFDEPF